MAEKLQRIVVKPFGKDNFETASPFKYKDIDIPVGYITDRKSVV